MYVCACQQKSRCVSFKTIEKRRKKRSKNEKKKKEFDFNIEALEIFQSNSFFLFFLCSVLFTYTYIHSMRKTRILSWSKLQKRKGDLNWYVFFFFFSSWWSFWIYLFLFLKGLCVSIRNIYMGNWRITRRYWFVEEI